MGSKLKDVSKVSCDGKYLVKYLNEIDQAFLVRAHSITNDNYQIKVHREIIKNLKPVMYRFFIDAVNDIYLSCNRQKAFNNCLSGICLTLLILLWLAYATLSYIVPIVFIVLVYFVKMNGLGINLVHIWLSLIHAIFLMILNPIKIATDQKSYKFKSSNAAIEEAQLIVLNENIERQQEAKTSDGRLIDSSIVNMEDNGNIDNVEHRTETSYIELPNDDMEAQSLIYGLIALIISIGFPIGQILFDIYDGRMQNNTYYPNFTNHSNSTTSDRQLLSLFYISFFINYMVYFIFLCISVKLYWTQSNVLERYFEKAIQHDLNRKINYDEFNTAHPRLIQRMLLTIKSRIRSIKNNTFAMTMSACAIVSIVAMAITAFVIYIVSHRANNKSIIICIVYIIPVIILGVGIIIKVLSINEIITSRLPYFLQTKKHLLTNQILAKQLSTTDENTHIQTLIYWRDYLDHNIKHMASRRDDDVVKILGFLVINKAMLVGVISSALTSAISLLLSLGKTP